MSNIPKGYKQTEVGMIPEDWEVKTLEDLCVNKGLVRGPFGGALKKEYFVESGIKVYEQKNAIYRSVDLGEYYIDDRKYNELKRFNLQPNDFIVSCSGTIGKIYLIPQNAPKGIINQALLKITTNDKIISKQYFYYYFDWDKFQERIVDNTQGGAMKNLIGMSTFRQTKIPFPSTIDEQNAIAATISDVDELLQFLEELIAKKRVIKQGVMQELLKPKEGWKKKSLFELAENKKEFFDDGDWIESEHIVSEGIRIIQTGNIGVGKFIDKEIKKYISEESFKKLKCKEVKEGDLLICRLAEPAGRSCIVPKIHEYKMVTAVDITIFRPSHNLADRSFLNNIFSTDKWFNTVNEKCGGTTRTRISRGELGQIKISIPSIYEQIRIAAILSDMDAEITALEAKLAKYKQIKQGMMQNLLTGRIRLV